MMFRNRVTQAMMNGQFLVARVNRAGQIQLQHRDISFVNRLFGSSSQAEKKTGQGKRRASAKKVEAEAFTTDSDGLEGTEESQATREIEVDSVQGKKRRAKKAATTQQEPIKGDKTMIDFDKKRLTINNFKTSKEGSQIQTIQIDGKHKSVTQLTQV